MKIAIYYSRFFETGGVEKTILARAKALKKAGYEITFIFSQLGPLDMIEKYAEIGDVKNIDICQDEMFDWVIYDAVYNLKKVRARKNNYIQVINGNLIDSNEFYEEVIPFKKYVAVSEQAKEQFKQRKGKDCIVIPNLIDESRIKELAKEKCEFEFPKVKHKYISVSRLDPQKGFGRIETMLQKLEDSGEDYFWLFVGSNYLYPKYGEQIKERFESKYKCKFIGMQENPYKYMAKADLLIQPSDYESQCMVMFESLICGTPCLCTDFDTAVETLKGDLGSVIKTDMSDFDVNIMLKKKPKIEYHYPDYGKEWLKLIEPVEKKNYKYSIIIPNYNNAKWLDKCLNSVLNQTYKNYEIIFVDDMSEDNSIEIASKLLKKHKIIKVPYKKYNGGARNIGILEATGDYIICLDSDDWLKRETTLEEINNQLEDEDVMFLGFDLFNGTQEGLFPFRPNYETIEQAFKNDVCAIWTKVVKTELLKDTLFPESTLAEDRVHHYRICEKANTFTCLNDSTHVWNRANSTSVTTKREAMWEMSIYKHLGEMYYFIATTKNENYKAYVIEKFNKQWKELESRRYQQI